MSILSEPHFHNADAARARLEEIVWPQGPYCPRCGGFDRITEVKGGRPGLRRCGPCKREFTVTVGTIFERSKVPLNKWFQAAHLLASSKKGFSAHQLHRTLGVTYKTAWFMFHRLREAMRTGEFDVFGSNGGSVEVDETFFGQDPDARPTPKHANKTWVEKNKVLTLVDRESGTARSFVVDSLKATEIAPILRANIAKEARLLTDEAPRYRGHGKMFADHQSVNHKKDEYVRPGEPEIHTNTVEGYFSIFKRGMKGVYQHCSKRHLHRYMAEYDFRYNQRSALGINDETRAETLIGGIVGKRLTYRDSSVPAAARE